MADQRNWGHGRPNWDDGRPKEFKRSSGLAFNFSGFFSQFNTSHYQSSHGRAKSCRLWMKEVMLRLRFWLDDEDDDDDETGVLIGGCGGWLYGGGWSATGDPQWTKHFDNNPVEENIVKVFINAKDIHTLEFIKKSLYPAHERAMIYLCDDETSLVWTVDAAAGAGSTESQHIGLWSAWFWADSISYKAVYMLYKVTYRWHLLTHLHRLWLIYIPWVLF